MHPSFGVRDPEGTFSSGLAPSRAYSRTLCPSTTAFTVPVNSHSSPLAPSPTLPFLSDRFRRGLVRKSRGPWNAGPRYELEEVRQEWNFRLVGGVPTQQPGDARPREFPRGPGRGQAGGSTIGRMRQFSAGIGCVEFNLRSPSGAQTPQGRSLRQPAHSTSNWKETRPEAISLHKSFHFEQGKKCHQSLTHQFPILSYFPS